MRTLIPIIIFLAAVVVLFLIGVAGWQFIKAPVWPLLLVVQAGLSVVLGSAALFVILSRGYTPGEKHWAYTTIGAILGFWLRGGH